jgi:hypothetical protein
VTDARQLLAQLDEPDVAVGIHCGAPHGCEFYTHCGPAATKYTVLGLGGSKESLYELMHSGYADLRDVPEDRLTSDTQRLIWRQSRAEKAHIGAELKQFARALRSRATTWTSRPWGRPCRNSRARGRSRRCRSNGRATSRQNAARSSTRNSST